MTRPLIGQEFFFPMATIKDVAKRAGVSTTTVSHVINKTRFVADDTKAAVWAAIKELNYSPSAELVV